MIGTTLGHYRFVEQIGEGGMGEVYRAHDERLDRDVAIKVLPEEVVGDSDRLHRFEREAKALAALNHPNIATVHGFETFGFSESDVGAGFISARDGGVAASGSESRETVHLLVMELLEGESLRELLSRGGVTTGKAVEYSRAIADGLAAAHDKGIVHRDLKPENVFLTKDGRIKILDFGLAKLKLPEAELTTETPTATLDTAPGGLLGTIPYMAPEQVQGQLADHRSDIFALGVVLYEMLTDCRPFGGSNSMETAAAILKEDPEPIAAPVPPTLSGVVSKCLEKRPEDRFNSAHDLSITLGTLDTIASVPAIQEQSFFVKRWPHVLAVVIAAVIALLVIWPPEALFERGAIEPALEPLPRIVVLPFENLGSPEDEYFSDGITDEITSRLTAVSGLEVISRTSAMYYKGRHLPLSQVGEELNVGYVLEGTIRWDHGGEGHGRVRITPQLVRVDDDTHLWSDRYDRMLDDIFDVQARIAEEVVTRLQATILEPERRAIEARLTKNAEAYEAFLLGQQLSKDFEIHENLELAIVSLERAVSLDPDFVVAWALLSHQYNRLYREQEPRQERKEAAWTAAQRAVELAPDLPDGWLARGRYFAYCERDHQRALAEYQRALEIRPGDRDVQEWTSYSLRRLGRWPESIAMLEKVIEADPLNSTVHRNIGTSYLTVRNFPQAERAFNRSIAIAPETVEGYMGKWYLFFWQGHLSGARAVLEEMRSSSSLSRVNWIRQEWAERRFKEALHRIAHMPESDYENAWGTAAWKFADECWTFVLMGDGDGAGAPCERARAGFEEQVERYPESPRAHLALSRTYSALGRREEAIAAAQRAVTILPISRDIAGAGLVENLAWIYSWFGEYDEAFDRLDNLLSIPSHVNVGRLRVDPQWDHVRDDPRFQELLERYDIQSN